MEIQFPIKFRKFIRNFIRYYLSYEENRKIGKIEISEEDQKSILRKVSNIHVSVDKIKSEDGANLIKTAVDVDNYKKKLHFISMFAWNFLIMGQNPIMFYFNENSSKNSNKNIEKHVKNY